MHLRYKCPNRGLDDYEWICFCAKPDQSARDILARKFINGWVHESWVKKANQLAADETASEEDLVALLRKIEYEANYCYGMWRNTL